MKLVLLGAPGVGKGTQAKKFSKHFNIPHISTGDILRKEIKKGTELGKKAVQFVESGKLVPDTVIIEIIKNKIGNSSSEKGFLMDGFPRNLKQSKMFSDMLDKMGIKLDKVINIVVGSDEIIERLSRRRTCGVCHEIFSIDNKDRSSNAKCPKCGGDLIKRKDDDIKVIKNRLEVYEAETKLLTDFYARKGLLINIDGSGKEKEVTGRILKHL